jgi:hypothetical protein
MNFERTFVLLVAFYTLLSAGCANKQQNARSTDEILSAIHLPESQMADLVLSKSWVFADPLKVSASYLYITGGIDNIDKGSPDWGTTDSRKFRMIGDYAGELRVSYDNQDTDTIPLVYGYTLWFRNGWTNSKEPFNSNIDARHLLDSTLYLNHIYEDKADYVLRIRLRHSAVNRIDYYDNRLKEGYVKFGKFQLSGVDNENHLPDSLSLIAVSEAEEGFYATHTVDTIQPYPLQVKHNLRRLMYLLYYFDFDHENVTDVDVPKDYQGPSIVFSGEPEANIISSVFHHNLADQVSRVDTNGLVHESAYKAPSWFYDGFGTWTNVIGMGEEKTGSYYECYYTRNKTIMVLPDLDYIEESNRALALLDKQLMYFPENFPTLQQGGKRIPGHWTVIVNNPLIYSHVLTGVGWPTQYTFEKFGTHYRDFGNPETDGHGHSMMSHWKTWHNSGRKEEWVHDRWPCLKEAADYILWHLRNPDLSFSKYGLLYAESEAAMNDYSLYCNFPCYLGLLMYAEMADSIGEKESGMRWRSTARNLKDSMEGYFAADDPEYGIIWRKVGFYHENILMTFKEYQGFDLTGKLPDDWIKRSLNTYLKERDLQPDYYGPTGLGYDHGVITQTAMMLDRMDEVTKWMRSLAHICHAPRLPRPYIVPECASIDAKRGIIRRQGDVGNGYQQAEIINTILLCAGIDDNIPGILKIMPRLPEKWDMKISDYPVIVYSNGTNYKSRIDMSVSCPEPGSQTVHVKVISGGDLSNVNIRLGPFDPMVEKVRIDMNGRRKADYPCFISGNKAWTWFVAKEIKAGSEITILAQE